MNENTDFVYLSTAEESKMLKVRKGNSVALADVDLKQWRPLMDLIASLPPDLAADRPPWPGPAAPRVTRKVTFTSLTRAQRADVARLYAIGVPVRDICARFNITKNTVIRLRKQAGVPQRHRGRDEPQGHEAEAMYASGTSPWPSPAATTRPDAYEQPEAPGE